MPNRLTLKITPITEEEARTAAGWQYEPPYSFYNSSPEEFADLLRPEYEYHAVRNDEDEFIGTCCFGPDAQVPGGDYSDYPDALDIGGGLRPDLTGQGIGLDALESVLEFAKAQFGVSVLRTMVASFNERAIKVCERAGFVRQSTFRRRRGNDEADFVILLLEQ